LQYLLYSDMSPEQRQEIMEFLTETLEDHAPDDMMYMIIGTTPFTMSELEGRGPDIEIEVNTGSNLPDKEAAIFLLRALIKGLEEQLRLESGPDPEMN